MWSCDLCNYRLHLHFQMLNDIYYMSSWEAIIYIIIYNNIYNNICLSKTENPWHVMSASVGHRVTSCSWAFPSPRSRYYGMSTSKPCDICIMLIREYNLHTRKFNLPELKTRPFQQVFLFCMYNLIHKQWRVIVLKAEVSSFYIYHMASRVTYQDISPEVT